MREIIHIISLECTGRLVGARAVQHNQSEADQQNSAGQQVIIIKIRRKFFLPLFFFSFFWDGMFTFSAMKFPPPLFYSIYFSA